jgi:hypothetical protein
MVFSVFWSSGCSPIQTIQTSQTTRKDKSPAAMPQEKFFVHKIVKPGENLTNISRWYTGSGDNWSRIVEANPLIDPSRIKIGDAILIPESLVKRREPMPSRYRRTVAEKKEQVSELSSAPLPLIRESELFGPLDIVTQSGHLERNGEPLPLETIE